MLARVFELISGLVAWARREPERERVEAMALHGASNACDGIVVHALMHSSIIESANQPHPGLIRDMGTPQTFLLLEAGQAGGELRSLGAIFRDAAGVEHFSIDLMPGR